MTIRLSPTWWVLAGKGSVGGALEGRAQGVCNGVTLGCCFPGGETTGAKVGGCFFRVLSEHREEGRHRS